MKLYHAPFIILHFFQKFNPGLNDIRPLMAIKIQALSDLRIQVSKFMEPVDSSAFRYCCIVACETQCRTYDFVDMPTKLMRGDFSKTLRCQIFPNTKKDRLVV